jgi:hypothetical protein
MIVVVFKKRKTSKPQMVAYTEKSRMTVDRIIDGAKRKPPIPNNWYLEEIGVGESFVKLYQEKYKISKVFYDQTF